ncbi:MAG: ATP-binding domain-containing protein, partial [Muricoprocola sp.]
MVKIRCVVERITYQNPENGYSVLKCAVKNYNELMTVVGNLLDAAVGSVLLIDGNWKVDAKYGRQFLAERWERQKEIKNVMLFLQDHGVSTAFAAKIYRQYGNESIPKVKENPFRLADDIWGIGFKTDNYDKEVFNGDIGIIESVNLQDRTLLVNFDNRSIEYDATELDELVHAYATTIHKAQGSEYPIVVMPVLMNHFVMLQRNLVYTGITRAKKILVMVGTKKALAYA